MKTLKLPKIVFVNKHPAGKVWNFLFGLACIADGLVVVFSLGFLSGKAQLTVTKHQSRVMIEKQKKLQTQKESTAEAAKAPYWFCEGCGQTDRSKKCFGCNTP